MRCAVLFRALSLLGRVRWLALMLSVGCSSVSTAPFDWFDAGGAEAESITRRPVARRGDRLSLSHLQLKGSHNSYHKAPRFSLSRQWKYTNAPLDVQLETQGVRQLELDVRYEHGELFVSHVPFLDGRSSCKTLASCLTRIRNWSKKQPFHLPVFVFIEAKEALVPSGLDGRIDAIESEISQVFPRSSLLTPADVEVPGLSLRDSVLRHGWPRVEEVRGRVAFVLFGEARHRRAYVRQSRAGRLPTMFVASTPERPEAAILMINDPVRHGRAIRRAVQAGFLVRTRADAALVRDRARRDAALASGAHIISTDFADPRNRWLEIGRREPARCNPVSAPTGCERGQLAQLEHSLWLAQAELMGAR